ncbi:MAG TPA: DUF3784 domain-containing protein [Algoriphagus sp.]|nr:DUF3784 domain-containing protein [Algoriphagus sp.]
MKNITKFQVVAILTRSIMKFLIIGIIFLAIGILVKIFPNLLAGYSNLSQRERENSQTNSLPTVACLIFTLMGLVTIVGHFASVWLNQPELDSNISMIVILGGAVALVVFSNLLTNKRIS